MENNKFSVVRIETEILERLTALSKAYGLTNPKQIRRMVEMAEAHLKALNIVAIEELPGPAGHTRVPVVYQK